VWGISVGPKRGREKEGREQRRRRQSRARLGTNGDQLPEELSRRPRALALRGALHFCCADYEGAMHDPRVHKAIQEDREVRRLRARAWLLFRRFHRLRLPWEAWPEHGGGRGGMKLARTRAQQCRRAAQAWR
jgi:hypothetical protein